MTIEEEKELIERRIKEFKTLDRDLAFKAYGYRDWANQADPIVISKLREIYLERRKIGRTLQYFRERLEELEKQLSKKTSTVRNVVGIEQIKINFNGGIQQ